MRSAPRFIRHIALDTGRASKSRREEIRDEAIAELRPLLARVVVGETVAVPKVVPEHVMTGVTAGMALTVAVYSPLMPGASERQPLLTLGVAVHSHSSVALWRALHGWDPGDPPLEEPPQLPWCGVRLLPALAHWPAAKDWLGGFERCVAWTWVEMQMQG